MKSNFNVIKKITVSILTILFLMSCNKDDIAKGTPKCVKRKIENFEKETNCDNGVKVEAYLFQGETVYVFNPGICGADMASEVINSNCESLGYLGGISGNTSINGENFSNATFVETVWEK